MSTFENGIQIYYENEKPFNYTVFFKNIAKKQYTVGGLLFEVISDESFTLITTQVEKCIHHYPEYKSPLTYDNLIDGLNWIYEYIDDDGDFPITIELFRSNFLEKVLETIDSISENYLTTGDFLFYCYQSYINDIKSFAMHFDLLAKKNSSFTLDDYEEEILKCFEECLEQIAPRYRSKCKYRTKNDGKYLETKLITNFIDLLLFETIRLRKSKKVIRICENCGRYFIPLGRSDTKYCFKNDPENPNKKCFEIGAEKKRIKKRTSDPIARQYHNKYCSLKNMIRREKQGDNNSDIINNCANQLKKEKEKYLNYTEQKFDL